MDLNIDIATDQQPLPANNTNTPIVWLVTHDLEKRAALGEKKYGQTLKAFNGRDALIDTYQEALDLVMYMRQAIAEREKLERELTRLKIENEALRAALKKLEDDLK